jgi:hypothetical protein
MSERHRYHLVIKSVDAITRSYVYSRARPEMKIVHIVRHPCGHIASRLRGIRLKLMGSSSFIATVAATPEAAARGLTLQRLEQMSMEEQMATRWMIVNDKIMTELEGHDSYRCIRYEDLCAAPARVSRQLFEFAGLDWSDQTTVFLGESNREARASPGYFEIRRPSAQAAAAWRAELDPGQVERIAALVWNSRSGALFGYSDDTDAAIA